MTAAVRLRFRLGGARLHADSPRPALRGRSSRLAAGRFGARAAGCRRLEPAAADSGGLVFVFGSAVLAVSPRPACCVRTEQQELLVAWRARGWLPAPEPGATVDSGGLVFFFGSRRCRPRPASGAASAAGRFGGRTACCQRLGQALLLTAAAWSSSSARGCPVWPDPPDPPEVATRSGD